jgi:hypothetical protein
MASRLVRALFVGGGAAAAALILGMGTASAAGTWSVTVGSATGTVHFRGDTVGDHSPSNPDIIFDDATSGLSLSCDAGTANDGTTTVGSGQTGSPIATIDGPSTTWTDCVGPLGLELDPHGIGTWNLQADSYDGSDVTTGRITDVNAHVSTPDGSSCVFDVTGFVNATFTNSTQHLAVSPDATLNISNVTGCFGLINGGDQASFQATYLVSSASGNVIITSP